MAHCCPSRTRKSFRFLKAWGVPLLLLLLGTPTYGQPPNDECAGATVIQGIPFNDTVDTTTATSNPDDPSLGCNGSGTQTDGNTVWYVWTPAEDIVVNISTDGSTEPGGDPLDTAHGVFTGTCGDLVEVACVDIGLTDDLFFEATGGVTYYIKIGEFLDGVGGGNLVVTVDLPPPPELIVLESVRDGVSPPISSVVGSLRPVTRSRGEGGVIEVPMGMKDSKGVDLLGKDGGAEYHSAPSTSSIQLQSFATGVKGSLAPGRSGGINLLQTFEGAENDDNDNILGFLLYPPDTNGDVGMSHYVQMINDLTTIFDKGGNLLLGPFPNNLFWSGLGGPCEDYNIGDPIVLYDEETDSWLVSQFHPFDGLCIAISEAGDPTGAYYQHEFSLAGIGFPDYPKYGFVTGAISVMANLFDPSFEGAVLGAIDKTEAFGAGPTTMVLFKLPGNEFGFLPGDNDGPVFDNMPPTFATNNDGMGNTIDFWEIYPDFAVPANSTIAEVARIPVTLIDGDLCNRVRERCIDQPEGAPRLEAISDRLMHRLQLRDFGQEKWAVVNHTVDADGSGKAGIRWYEFWNHKDRGWTLKKENTFSPDGDHRWMGSIAMNAKGETCVGYSISSTTTYPSIGVAGRRGRASHLNVPELVVHDGNVDQHVQLGNAARWGDYSAMAIDPVDDTCWYTQEYTKPNTRLGEIAGWATKIFQFELQGGN